MRRERCPSCGFAWLTSWAEEVTVQDPPEAWPYDEAPWEPYMITAFIVLCTGCELRREVTVDEPREVESIGV